MNGNAAAVIAMLAQLHRQLTDLAASLRLVPEVVDVTTSVTPRRYSSEDRVECYVEAKLRNDNVVTMWLDFGCDNGSWDIESSVLHNTDLGQDTLVRLPTRYAVDDEALALEVDRAMQALEKAAKDLNLKTLELDGRSLAATRIS